MSACLLFVAGRVARSLPLWFGASVPRWVEKFVPEGVEAFVPL